jgi:hypothetical protein
MVYFVIGDAIYKYHLQARLVFEEFYRVVSSTVHLFADLHRSQPVLLR